MILGAEPRDGACAGETRLDPRGPGAPGRHRYPRRHRNGQRSRSHGTCAGENQADDGKLFAHPGVRGRRYRRRPFGARSFRPLWRGPVPDVDQTQCRAEGRQDLARSARAGLSVVSPGNPERVQNAQANARQYTSPQGGERDRETYLAAIDNIVFGEDPSEGFVRGRRLSASRARLHFLQPPIPSRWTIPRKP